MKSTRRYCHPLHVSRRTPDEGWVPTLSFPVACSGLPELAQSLKAFGSEFGKEYAAEAASDAGSSKWQVRGVT